MPANFLNRQPLAFHHRLGGERAAIAEAEHGGAVGDNADQIALGGIFVSRFRVFCDLLDRNGHAGRIGETQVVLGQTGLRGNDLDLSLAALGVIAQHGFPGDLFHAFSPLVVVAANTSDVRRLWSLRAPGSTLSFIRESPRDKPSRNLVPTEVFSDYKQVVPIVLVVLVLLI